MPKKEIIPEQLFYDQACQMIRNLLINNINYTNGYYYKEGARINDMITDTKERAAYILERLESMKHLIIEEAP